MARTQEEIMAGYGENHRRDDEAYDHALAVSCRNGTFIGQENEQVRSYKGIPYARPPVGDLRWKRPVAAAEDQGVYEAFYYGKSGMPQKKESREAVMPELKKSICPYDCPNACGFLMEVENGKILRVMPDPEHPVSRGGICRKTARYQDSIHSEKRLLTPLVRTGPKGSGRFEPLSWEEAVQRIAGRWKQIIAENGPEAILPWTYSGVMSDIQRSCGDAFFNRMGASQLVQTICAPAKGAGYAAVAGKTGCLDPRELADSDLYLIWGSNMAANRPQALALLSRPENRHKKKILIDTYASPTARYCDQVLYIKAGTDGALALAMMHVLQAEGLADEVFLQNYTEGYDLFKETLPSCSPGWAETITGIPAETIRMLAREYGRAHAPAILLGSGNSRYGNGGMTVRLITILSLFTGAWQYPGGGLCGCTPIATSYVDRDRILRPDFRRKPARRLNINQTASALALTGTDAVRSLYVYAGNPANTAGNQDGVIRGLLREDLFTVVHERFMTETALYADIILPATFSVEQCDIYRSYGHCTLGTAYPLIAAPGACKSNWDTFALLAEAMGYEEAYFRRSEREVLEDILDHPTPAVAALPEEKQRILREGGAVSMPFSDHLQVGTPSGKFRIVDPSLPEPMPCYREAYGGDLPLRLVSSPGLYTLNSEFRDREELLRQRGSQKLILHTRDAEERGIRNGCLAEAYNEQASVVFEAVVTDAIAPGNAVCEGVFRRDDCVGGKAFNALTSERLSDLAEGTTMNDNRVEVRVYGENTV